ncbi:MAG: sulfur carrier protein ThiS [Verrucomicrobiia bacterium]
MTILVNGASREVGSRNQDMTVEELIVELGQQGRPLIVERNGKALVRSEWAETNVHEGDRYELVLLVAGG